MRALILSIFVILSPSAFAVVDYSLLDHSISITKLRAGNHDKSGTNSYYFTAIPMAVANSKEDLKKDLKERKKSVGDVHKFGVVAVDALSIFVSEEPEVLQTEIGGDAIRVLVSNAMRELNLPEHEIAVLVQLTMYETETILWYFGSDRRIGRKYYFPVPASKYQTPGRVNLTVDLTDNFGAEVTFSVNYKNPIKGQQQETELPPVGEAAKGEVDLTKSLEAKPENKVEVKSEPKA